MNFEYIYRGSSAIESQAYRTNMSFVPDASREPTFFSGELRSAVAFREAMSALHDVVVSDLRFKPKDKTEYKAWAAQQQEHDIATIMAQRVGNAKELEELVAEHADLVKKSAARLAPFRAAQKKYFDWLYVRDRDAWFVLDPVITVHPDEIFFECFSQDESSYGRLGASYEVFGNMGPRACGTTNIDYSAALYDEFQKIRSYKTTRFDVDPTGFEVKTTGEEDFREVKIDLPDSWVRGFLQVNSAMTLPTHSFDLHPMDVHDICFVLRRRKEKLGPRSLRFHLVPGEPVRITFEPWNTSFTCKRSVYSGRERDEIRIWGRRRLRILERLIPVARRFKVHLLGTGMPSFWLADLGDMTFTLGLSGWTANDWSSAGNFDLLAPRTDVDETTKIKVFQALKREWLDTPDGIAQKTGFSRGQVLSALSAWTQAGRAIFDLGKGVYRARELSREPLPIDALRFANEREERALRFVEQKSPKLTLGEGDQPGTVRIKAVFDDATKQHYPTLDLDGDGRIVHATCTCNFFQQNQLRKGPCEHMLAARMLRNRRTQ